MASTQPMQNHPDLSLLIDLLSGGGDLVIAEGTGNCVIVTGRTLATPSFTFTKTSSGYTVERTK